MPGNYYLLTTELFKTEYVPDSAMNESRVVDVIRMLRDPYDFHSDYPVSIFEVFITLSIRASHDIIGDEDPAKWFWLFMDNWGMGRLDDDHFDVMRYDYFLERIGRAFGNKKVQPVAKNVTVDLFRSMINYLSDNYV